MREYLLDYLMDALEEDERQRVEAALRRDPALCQELETLKESLPPLELYRGDFEPPDGLVDATCQLVAEHRAANAVMPSTLPAANAMPASAATAPASRVFAGLASAGREPVGQRSRWSLTDLSVAGGVFIAAGLLLLPAIQQSRFAAQRTVCQDNLQTMGRAAGEYSQLNGGMFPEVAETGNFSAAGMFPVRLFDGGFLDDVKRLVCPTSPAAQHGKVPHVPSLEELRSAEEPELRQYRLTMGGDYAYPLGYVENRVYHSAKNRHRSHFPIVSDAPVLLPTGYHSANHGGYGQNVLFEDGHVEWTTSSVVGDYGDNIFHNDVGLVAAGRHVDDAVCARSSASPVPFILPVRATFEP